MILSCIVAISENYVIGKDGGLPWHLPDDLRRFKALTMGHPILMGRKTYESIGRPLPGRTSIVITQNPAYKAQGTVVVPSLETALEEARRIEMKRREETANRDDCAAPEVFVIGGQSIFKLALPRADRLYVTHVHATVEGDVFFPRDALCGWEVAQPSSAVRHEADRQHAFPFTFQVYHRPSSHHHPGA